VVGWQCHLVMRRQASAAEQWRTAATMKSQAKVAVDLQTRTTGEEQLMMKQPLR